MQQLSDGYYGNASDPTVITAECDFGLPVESEADLAELETRLQDKDQLNSLVSFLIIAV